MASLFPPNICYWAVKPPLELICELSRNPQSSSGTSFQKSRELDLNLFPIHHLHNNLKLTICILHNSDILKSIDIEESINESQWGLHPQTQEGRPTRNPWPYHSKSIKDPIGSFDREKEDFAYQEQEEAARRLLPLPLGLRWGNHEPVRERRRQRWFRNAEIEYL